MMFRALESLPFHNIAFFGNMNEREHLPRKRNPAFYSFGKKKSGILCAIALFYLTISNSSTSKIKTAWGGMLGGAP